MKDAIAKASGWLGKHKIAVGLCFFLAIAGFYLWIEYKAQLFGFLPYAILIACPLIHLFMHKGRVGHGEHERHGDDENPSSEKDVSDKKDSEHHH